MMIKWESLLLNEVLRRRRIFPEALEELPKAAGPGRMKRGGGRWREAPRLGGGSAEGPVRRKQAAVQYTSLCGFSGDMTGK